MMRVRVELQSREKSTEQDNLSILPRAHAMYII
jgi:hypothetical protein